MPMDEVIDKYNLKRVLGEPGKAVARREFNTWTLPDDAQVDTPNGIRSVPGGTIVVEVEQGQLITYSITEFNELYILAEVRHIEDALEEEVDEEVEGEKPDAKQEPNDEVDTSDLSITS